MTAIRKCGNSSIYELVTDTLHENKWPHIDCIVGPQATKQKAILSTDTPKFQNYMWDNLGMQPANDIWCCNITSYLLLAGRIYSIFETRGQRCVSCLADATWRPALSCLACYFVWPKTKHSYTCFSLLAKLIVIGLHNAPWGYHACTKGEINIHIYWKKTWYVGNDQNPDKQGKQVETRWHQDKKLSPGFENMLCKMIPA